MATLKVCTMQHTYWVCDVSRVWLQRSFSVKDPADPLASLGGEAFGSVVNVVDFPPARSSGEAVGHLLQVHANPKPGGHGHEWWVVPDSSTFLMADNGKTIDRF